MLGREKPLEPWGFQDELYLGKEFPDSTVILKKIKRNLLISAFWFQDQSLTGTESEREKGLRVFKSHDQQGNAGICCSYSIQ